MANWSHRKKDFLYRMTGGLCWYCGSRANSIDHMVPVSRGGSNAYGNVVPACKPCNNNKSDQTVAEFRLRKSRQHRFWGEINGYDPRWPLWCMSWRGSFGVLHERNEHWLASFWHWVKRKGSRRGRKARKRINRWVKQYGIASR
jgi:hypothetical protein